MAVLYEIFYLMPVSVLLESLDTIRSGNKLYKFAFSGNYLFLKKLEIYYFSVILCLAPNYH